MLLACVAVLVLALLATAVDARACSCAQPDPGTYLQDSDAAFVGRLVERKEASGGAILTFSVERAVKGKLGDRVDVRTARDGAGCGIEAPVGERVGLFLIREGSAWIGSLCRQVSPDDLLAAAAPLPPPNGRGAPALWVGGRFGKARMLALDARGRTLAYGGGNGRTQHLSVCPGGRRVAELVYDGLANSHTLAIRHGRTLRMVRQRTVRLPGTRVPAGLLCENASGSSVVLFAFPSTGRGFALYRLKNGTPREIWRGSGTLSSLVPRTAYLNAGYRGRRLAKVDLRTGRFERIATLPHAPHLVPDATGRRLAGVAPRTERRSRLVLVDLRGKAVVVRWTALDDANVDGQVHWLPGGRLLFLPAWGNDTGRVLDPSLRTVRRFPWASTGSALVGSRAYGVTIDGKLMSVEPAGQPRVVRRLPGGARPSVIVSATR